MENKKERIRKEIVKVREVYNKLLYSLTNADMAKKSKNAGWTNGEILFHILLGFIVVILLFPLVKMFARLPKSWSKKFANFLNFSTPVFNFLNALGARVGGKIFNKELLKKKFDWVIEGLLKKLSDMKENDWEMGMYAPNKWDSLFDEFMTLEKLFSYPVKHFNFHAKQIQV